ncbi:glutamate--cysteine ligase catalytic subunit [Nematocida displodere]|uniref:Glutamate--cysteine ligase n=1 Tax=Nematocida displodere TaxID=1805483 RepID=A0A177ELB8_9MICR|nr:glutamate--cysteine ligase catalytic subunit [Nematocida displodere]
MGLLKESRTLSWEETQATKMELKKRGAKYFAEVFKAVGSTRAGEFLWGEELEQLLVARVGTNFVLFVGAGVIIDALSNDQTCPFNINIEYSRYMVETTPKCPYAPKFKALVQVEQHMEERRTKLEKTLSNLFGGAVFPLFLPCFPLLGSSTAFGSGTLSVDAWEHGWASEFKNTPMNAVPEDLKPEVITGNHFEDCLRLAQTPSFKVTRSEHFPDFAITPHRRFHNFTYNIRERKKKPLHLSIPPARINRPNEEASVANTPPVVIDSMGQGMGCCCLQITMQSESLTEARLLYDNIGAICPLLLFLTMATSTVSGTLTETSTRWEIISASVDCRTETETHIKKSRYSSIDLYVSNLPPSLYAIYNDIEPPLEPEVLSILEKEGVDQPLANHIASLYIRDPVLCYEDSTPREDFENIQSSNWRSMRLKSPKIDDLSAGGWLVEVRPMEIQPTSFENAAYSIFVVLFSRMVLSLNMTFYLPISKVDENFTTANTPQTIPQTTDEWLHYEEIQKFWYRENIFDMGPPVIKYGTIKEIFLGTGEYCGIVGAVEKYLNEYTDQDTRELNTKYLQFIKERVSGKKMSVATYLRSFVAAHPAYQGDARIPQEVSNDLVQDLLSITQNNTPEYLNRK